jgi:hypothetical protein
LSALRQASDATSAARTANDEQSDRSIFRSAVIVGFGRYRHTWLGARSTQPTDAMLDDAEFYWIVKRELKREHG